jgi:hypothetical protein
MGAEKLQFRLFGYEAGSDREKPLSLAEVTVAGDPESLRELAAFLERAADRMERDGADFGHDHFEDQCDRVPEGLAFIVACQHRLT